ncbi:MAG: Transcriptional regulator [Clostridium sp.]|jgi:hypothetical protein
MAKFEKQITGNFDAIVANLEHDILENGLSMNLVDESDFQCGNTKIAVRVYDKYFMRNKSRASLNLTVVSNNDQIFISAIGAGGGNGVLFNISWGAETKLTNIVENSLQRMGY